MAYDELLADRVRDHVVDAVGDADLAERRMFGGLALLVNGHMAVGVSGQGGLMVRVGRDHDPALLDEPGAAPMTMRGRPMSGWLRVAADGVQDDPDLDRWVTRGVAYARSLPPK